MRAALGLLGLVRAVGGETLLVGGEFTESGNYSSVVASELAGGAGAAWTAFSSAAPGLGLSTGGAAWVASLWAAADDAVVVGGHFDAVCSGCPAALAPVVLRDDDGGLRELAGVGSHLSDPAAAEVRAALQTADGHAFVGGSFRSALSDNLLVYSPSADAWQSGGSPTNTTLGGGCDSSVGINAMAFDEGTQTLVAGGCFDSVSGAAAGGLLQWSAAGGVEPFVGGGAWGDDAAAEVTAVAIDSPLGVMYVAGNFSGVGNVTCSGLAAWDTAAQQWQCPPGLDGLMLSTSSVTVTPDGALVLTGSTFVSALSKPLPAVVRYIPATGAVSRLATQSSGEIRAATVTAGGAIVYGGCFSGMVAVVSGALDLPALTQGDGECVSALASVAGASGDDDGGGGGGGADDDGEHELVGILLPVVLVTLLVSAYVYREKAARCLSGDPGERAATSSFDSGTGSYVALSHVEDGGPALDMYAAALRARAAVLGASLAAVDPSEVALDAVIGHGAFSKVWRATWRGQQVAVKELVFAQAALRGHSMASAEILEALMREVGVMLQVRHPKVLRVLGVCVTMEAVLIVTELCPRGSLRAVLDEEGAQLSINTRVRMAMDVAEGLWHLHSCSPPVIHRDIKSSNLLCCDDYSLKVGDWGTAREASINLKEMTGGVGSSCWLSPEAIKADQFSAASDMYAFGIVLWELWTGDELYPSLSATEVVTKVAYEGLRPDIPEDCPELLADVMRRCWAEDPAERPSGREVLELLERLLEGTSDIVLL